ncbi:MAG: RNA pseudouridine synthase [Deltaproteobacteria bacterium]|nr:RNA pseudouridine synthase [Deltaproteobacteria bacterium]
MSVLSYREFAMGSSSTLSENLRVVFEDTQIIVVFKPHRVLTQGDASGDFSLFEAVKSWIKHKYEKTGNVYLGLVHRLDRPTAGLMVFAKTSKAASRLSEQVRGHGMRKRYRAWVSNEIRPNEGTLVHYLTFNEKEKKTRVYTEPADKRQKAILSYQVKRKENRHYLVEVELVTGRKHQIRAQLSTIGAPIVGDKKYGSSEDYQKGAIALESYYLSFLHPTKREMVEFTLSEDESAIIGGFV